MASQDCTDPGCYFPYVLLKSFVSYHCRHRHLEPGSVFPLIALWDERKADYRAIAYALNLEWWPDENQETVLCSVMDEEEAHRRFEIAVRTIMAS